MAQALQPVRGTHDLLAAEYAAHQRIALTAQEIAARYGYARIDTPMFEFSDVFHRATGETSDIVTKETYSFTDRGGEQITLRPELTAGVVRAYISNGLQQFAPYKCFYHGPAFRYERPQKGRQRQFHQFGVELLGASEPTADIEIIALAAHLLEALGVKDVVTLQLNSLGDAQSRAAYREALVAYLTQHQDGLSEDSLKRLDKNPLRILDSKDLRDREIISGAPTLHAFFNAQSRAHFEALTQGLDALGIAYTINETLVRGLDYYTHTVFEFTTEMLGAQGTVLAGGRYDGLVELMGGPATAGIGFGAGMERLYLLLETLNLLPAPRTMEITVVPMQDSTEAAAWGIAQSLRHAGFSVDIAYKGKPGKRLQRADKLGVRLAVMLGEEEMANHTVVLKDLQQGTQQTVPQHQLIATLGTK